MKKFLTRTGKMFLLGGTFTIGAVVFAAATIPAACSTPGTCTDLSATFQAVVAETSLKLTDADNSNFVELKSPATVAADVTLTLPDTDGNNGEVLSTDGTGILSWITSAVGSLAGLSDTDVTGVAAGATMYFDGTNWIDLPAGTAGQALAMNAGATAPEWVSGAPTEDLETVLGRTTPTANNIHAGASYFTVLDNGVKWNELAGLGYEHIRFDVQIQDGSTWYSIPSTMINVVDLTNNHQIWTTSDSIGNWSVKPKIGALNTGEFEWRGDNYWEGARVTVTGIKKPKVVVSAGDLPLIGGTGTAGQVLVSNGDGTASFVTLNNYAN